MNPLLHIALFAIVYFVARAMGKSWRNRRAMDSGGGAVMAGLRQMALSCTASDVAAPPVAGVFGVLMELGVGRGVATIVGVGRWKRELVPEHGWRCLGWGRT